MYTIREGRLGDLGVFSAMRAKMFKTFHDTDPQALLQADNAFFGSALETGRARFWLAEDSEGNVVACGAVTLVQLPPKPFSLEGRCVYLSSMWTEPEHRRKGLGGRLVNRAMEFAREIGAVHVCLHATDAGRPLYERHGFAGTNEMRLAL